jgi:chemotaxis protein methyltransferase CheR
MPAASTTKAPTPCIPLFAGGSSIADEHFEAIRQIIYHEAGISLSDAKRALVCSRLAKRLRTLKLRDHGEYLTYLANRDPRGEEMQRMVNALTTNKTDFFREPHHFAFLHHTVFPAIERQVAYGGPRRIRIWSAGCSNGHEPYSIAMTILDHFRSLNAWDVRVLASDINTQVLDTARQGIYPAEQLEPVDPDTLRKYFLRGTGSSAGLFQVRPEVRRLIEFRQINFMAEPWPIRVRFDVVFCRNVIIYFDLATQRKLTLRLSEQVADGGYLMLGHSEHPVWLTDHLTLTGNTIYQQNRKAKMPPSVVPAPRLVASRSAPAVQMGTAVEVPRIPRREIVSGDVVASATSLEISTVLGSCVAACLFDPEARIGGMNHFMLPSHTDDPSISARYGVHAMEILINEIMKLGGDRRRLQAKVFGGSRVLQLKDQRFNVARSNSEFVRKFLAIEKIPILAERLDDEVPLRVHFLTDSGRAFVKAISRSVPLVSREQLYSKRLAEQVARPRRNNVTLF